MKRSIRWSLFGTGLLAAVLAVLLAAVLMNGGFEQQVKDDLRTTAGLIADGYNYTNDQDILVRFNREDLRITLIASDGSVLFESDWDPGQMDNHLSRPEIADAFAHGSGQSVRQSDTLGRRIYYYAQRLPDGTVLRVSTEASSLYRPLLQSFPWLLLLLAVLVVLSMAVSKIMTRRLLRPITRLTARLDEGQPTGEDDAVYPELYPLVHKIQVQRTEIQRRLRREEEDNDRLSVIIQTMAEGLLVLDTEGKVILANDSVKALLGCGPQVEGKHILTLSRDPDVGACVEAAAAGRTESAYVTLSGKQCQVLCSPVITDDKQGGVICFVLDVTEKMQIEKMRREFTANVSHELKTPLTSISGYAEMIESGIARPEDVGGFAATIRKEAGRLLTLISDIIRLSELDEAGVAEEREPVDLLQLARDCADTLSMSADRHRVTLAVEGAPCVVSGNRSMLSELVYNLCDNAIRYNREGGEVRVQVGDSALTVRDTGIGIPEKHQARVFERFYRVDKSRSKETGGTGLGLAIVKHIAEQHHAKLELQSTVGVGTSITVRFPVNA